MTIVVLALLIFVLLVAVLALLLKAPSSPVGSSAAPNQRGTVGRLCDGIWNALHPNFVGFEADRATTQTLDMLIAAMLIFAAVTVLWATGAGVMRTAWLYSSQPGGASSELKAGMEPEVRQ